MGDLMNSLAAEIHAGNIRAGWWSMGVEHRNRPEILMLIVSEVGEAAEGLDGRPDDKLPHLPMFHVELGDTSIRLLDVIGADAPSGSWDYDLAIAEVVATSSREGQLLALLKFVCRAMEAHRKGRTAEYQQHLWNALAAVHVVATVNDVDLPAVIAEKRAYNAQRADHKPENRLKAGGKAY